MWVRTIFRTCKRGAAPHGLAALTMAALSLSAVLVDFPGIPGCTLSARAAEESKETTAVRADGGRGTSSPVASTVKSDSGGISVLKRRATLRTGEPLASSASQATALPTSTQGDNTVVSNCTAGALRTRDDARGTEISSPKHRTQSKWPEQSPPVASAPPRDKESTSRGTRASSGERDWAVARDSSLDYPSIGPSENYSAASDDKDTSVSGRRAAHAEPTGGENHNNPAGAPESEIFEGRSRLEALNGYATSLTDKFAEKVASLTAQVDLLRMDVVRARNEVQRLNDAFDARTEETIRKIEERSTNFGADLSQLEKQLEWQLNPATGVVSKRIGELRHALLNLRARARDMFEKEATVYVQQVESCSSRLDSLTEIYFDLKTRTDMEVNEIESCMVAARRKLEDTLQEQLNILTATEREAAARASQRFKSFLRNLRLEGNVLQSLVTNIQRRFLESQATFGDSGPTSARGAVYIDMSGLFANSKVEKVCVVVTHLVKGLLAGNEVVPIFIHSVSPKVHKRRNLANGQTVSVARFPKGHAGEPSLLKHKLTLSSAPVKKEPQMQPRPHFTRTSKSPNVSRRAGVGKHRTAFDATGDSSVEMVLPNAEILKKAAALWLRERREYGLSYDHYAVIRIEGYLMEYFSVPVLDYNAFSYATEDDFLTVNAEQFATSLKSSIEEKLSSLEAGLQKQTYLLIAYVGEVAADKDVVRPRPSLLQTNSRVRLARQLTQNVKPRSPSMYFTFQSFQRVLHFLDKAEQMYSERVKRQHVYALLGHLTGDDIRILVLTDDGKHGADGCNMWGPVTARSRSGDPFFGSAFAVLRLTLKQVAPDFLVFPSDHLLAVALDQLVWEVAGGSRPPGALSLFHVSLNEGQKHSGGSANSGKGESLQRSSSWPRHTSGALITTDGKARRGWAAATLTASLSLFVQRRKGQGIPASNMGLMVKDAGNDDVVTITVLKESSQHAVRASCGSTVEEVTQHTLNATLRVLRGKLDYVGRGYTLYVCVNLT